MKVTFWGVRGSIATPGPETAKYGGNTPCITVEQDGTTIILDAGTGIRKLGLALQGAAQGVPLHLHLILTHVHWDHIQGFPFFVPAFVPGNRLEIYGTRPSEKTLEKVLRSQMDREYFPVSLGGLSAEIHFHELRDRTIRIGPFEVSHTEMDHPGVSTGYRIAADGKAVVYATDTELYHEGTVGLPPEVETERKARGEDLLVLASDADLYIADSQYTREEYEQKVGWGHSCYEDAVGLALGAKVKCLALFSHDPMHDDDQVSQKLAHATAIAREQGSSMAILAAKEGQEIEV